MISATDLFRSLSDADDSATLEAEDAGPMLIATESFDAIDSYTGRCRVTAGITRIRAGHEIVLEHPEAFEPLAAAQQPAYRSLVRINTTEPVELRTASAPLDDEEPVSVTRSSVEHALELRYTPEFRQFGTSPVRVVLTPVARRQIADYVLQFSDGRETGGALYAHRNGDPTTIIGVTPPGDHDERTRTSFSRDLERERRFLTDGDRITGAYHSHPDSAIALPSDTDLRSWAAGRDVYDTETFIGIIVTPNVRPDPFTRTPMGFRDAQITAFVVRTENGQLVAEPADIEERYAWE